MIFPQIPLAHPQAILGTPLQIAAIETFWFSSTKTSVSFFSPLPEERIHLRKKALPTKLSEFKIHLVLVGRLKKDEPGFLQMSFALQGQLFLRGFLQIYPFTERKVFCPRANSDIVLVIPGSAFSADCSQLYDVFLRADRLAVNKFNRH